MSTTPAISVVIPAYNAEAYLRRCVDSACAQTFRPQEIVLVNDGSTDGTALIAESYGDAVKHVFQENGGEPAARNTGVRRARGDWIAFLDADDEWRPHHLMNAVKCLQSHPELKWYGAPADAYVHESGRLVNKYVKKENGILVDDAYFEDYMIAFPPYAHFSSDTMVIHRSVFDEVGMFDSERLVGCDIDMWFRIGLRFPKVGYCHEVAANIYRRSSSLSHTKKWDYQFSLKRFREKEMLSEEVGHDARRRAEPRIIYWVTKLLRAAISRSDCQAVREILAEYDQRLAPRWRWFARGFLLAPWAFKLAFRLRDIFSPKQRMFQAHGLRRHGTEL